jgi:hypothetical protein
MLPPETRSYAVEPSRKTTDKVTYTSNYSVEILQRQPYKKKEQSKQEDTVELSKYVKGLIMYL